MPSGMNASNANTRSERRGRAETVPGTARPHLAERFTWAGSSAATLERRCVTAGTSTEREVPARREAARMSWSWTGIRGS